MRADRFSDRMGFTEPRVVFQISDIDEETRTDLFNIVYEELMINDENFYNELISRDDYESSVLRKLWTDYFHNPLLSIRNSSNLYSQYILEYIKHRKGYEILTMIEELSKIISSLDMSKHRLFNWKCNNIFEKQLVGYRFIDGILAPITSDIEVNTINESLNATACDDKFGNVNKHLKSALELFSNRDKPDYRNSIKESICAIEALMAKLTNAEKCDFDKHLKKLSVTIDINNTLKVAFDKLYGYTNDGNGIRHSMIKDECVSSEEAKYMLIACNAFVTYLISKSAKTGISNETLSANTTEIS